MTFFLRISRNLRAALVGSLSWARQILAFQISALMTNFMHVRQVQIAAVCDVKQANRDRAKARAEKTYGAGTCTTYTDLRELCARDDLDVVTVATPDHWHIPAAVVAVRAGKDVYVEKPLGMCVEHGKALRAAARAHGAVIQFGTQERSAWSTRFACELVRNGRIGKVSKITVASRFSRAHSTG